MCENSSGTCKAHSRRFDAINMVLINSRIVDFANSRVEVHPQARPLAKSRRVGPHRGPPTPRSTRMLATGHPHLARPSKDSPGCCWWVESSKCHAYCRRAAAEMAATSTWVMLVPGVPTSVVAGFVLWSKKDNTFGQPDPIQKFGKKGQDGAVQNCCPFFGDPKVTF